MPSELPASWTRARSKHSIRPEKPCPSSPSRRSSATKHSSKCSSPAGKQRLPIFGSRSPSTKPGSPRSTTKAVMPFERVPGATVANTTQASAIGAFPMNFLWPSIT